MTKRKRTKGQTMIYNTLHRKLKSTNTNPIKTGGAPRCARSVRSSCSTSDIRRVAHFTHQMISHEWGKDRFVNRTNGTCPWSFVTLTLRNGYPSHGGDSTTFQVTISHWPLGTLGSVASPSQWSLSRWCHKIISYNHFCFHTPFQITKQ